MLFNDLTVESRQRVALSLGGLVLAGMLASCGGGGGRGGGGGGAPPRTPPPPPPPPPPRRTQPSTPPTSSRGQAPTFRSPSRGATRRRSSILIGRRTRSRSRASTARRCPTARGAGRGGDQ